MTILLHSFVGIEDNRQTWHALEDVSFTHPDLVIVHQKVEGPDGYWKFLMDFWGADDIINVEQDIVATPTHVEDLLSCHYDTCTTPYKLNASGRWSLWSADFTDDPTYKPIDSNGPVWWMKVPYRMDSYVPPFPEFVECSGFGLVKIRKEAQLQIPLAQYPKPEHKWDYIDSWVSYYMLQNLQKMWHVHPWEVVHNHK